MFDDLYEYFILNRQLSLPGIGLFSLERIPAEADFANRVIHSPRYKVSFVEAQSTPTKGFFMWLAVKMNISYSEAIVNFNAFAYDLKNEILGGTRIVWPRIGVLSKGTGNAIKVEPIIEDNKNTLVAPAVKVLREKAEHTVRVGEDERTSAEMEALLHQTNSKNWSWKTLALIVALICVLLIAIHLLTNGVSTSNQQGVTPAESPSLHRVIQ